MLCFLRSCLGNACVVAPRANASTEHSSDASDATEPVHTWETTTSRTAAVTIYGATNARRYKLSKHFNVAFFCPAVGAAIITALHTTHNNTPHTRVLLLLLPIEGSRLLPGNSDVHNNNHTISTSTDITIDRHHAENNHSGVMSSAAVSVQIASISSTC